MVSRRILLGVGGGIAAYKAVELLRLLADPTLRGRFGRAGRETIERRYSLRINGPRLADVFRSVAAGLPADRAGERA